jgi:DNA invertase Pin-like site-specific DNA recombinase
MDAQEAAIAAHVAATGCALLKTYTEVESGRNNDRTQLALAMAHAKRAKATLVIAKLDRLARNVHFISGLMEGGVDFVALDLPGADRRTIHIMAAIAEGEALDISKRTKAGLAALKARNLWSEKKGRHVTLGAPHHLTNGVFWVYGGSFAGACRSDIGGGRRESS